MNWVNIHNLTQPLSAPLRARYCGSFFCRLRGLTFRRNLPSGEGLLLVQARESRLDAAIHMLFVWMDLAVIWLNDQKQVVDICLARSWKPLYKPKKPARYVLEVADAWIHSFEVGDQIDFEEITLD